MELVILNLIWALECLMMIVCLHIVNAKTIIIDWKLPGCVIVNNILSGLRYYLPGLGLFTCLSYIILFVYCYYVFKKKLVETLARYAGGILLSGVLEVVSIFILSCFIPPKMDDVIKTFIPSVLAIIIAVILYCKVSKSKGKVEFQGDKRTIIAAVFLGIVLLFVLEMDFRIYHVMHIGLDIVVLILACGLIAYLYLAQKKKYEVKLRDRELEVHKTYSKSYDELIKDIRKKQHDYKNQLTTLQSMHLTADGAEDLINMQKQYATELEKNHRYESILTCCDNSILAGYLYRKCVEIHNQGVCVEYKLNITGGECKMHLHEMVEILGILLDNAVEYLSDNDRFEKCIGLNINEAADYISIEVRNPAEIYSGNAIEHMFQEGYSTKGDNRGLGLTRVKQLAAEYSADIIVGNKEYENQNWIEFLVRIGK